MVRLPLVDDLEPSNQVRGWYNPDEFSNPNDFQAGDVLTLLDYDALLSGGLCSQRSLFDVVGKSETGWNMEGTNIRIGRKGLVGLFYADFYVEVYAKSPVKMLWTDGVNATVTVFQEKSWAGWPREVVGLDTDPTLRPFEEPLSGKIRTSFEDAGLFDLNGLVTQRDGGGLHLALCE